MVTSLLLLMAHRLSHLDTLASEAIHIIREVVAEFERPALLFSGGKDSAVLLPSGHQGLLAQRVPFPIVHVDTGHNFPEVIEYRDQQVSSSRSGSWSARCRRTSTAVDRRAAGARRHTQQAPDFTSAQGA